MPGSRLFISHSSQDIAWCRPFVAALRAAGYTCFYDEDSIPGTAAWVNTIEGGIRDCDLFVLILSPAAWASQWVQDERQLAQAKRKPFLTLQHLATPEVDGFLTIRQWINAVGLDPQAAGQRATAEIARLGLAAGAVTPAVTSVPLATTPQSFPIPTRLARLGFAGMVMQGIEVIVPPVCDVPSGTFTMGSDKQHDPHAFDNEIPQYDIFVPAFQIGSYPLTVAEYACAVKAGAVKAPQTGGSVTWQKQQQHPDHPVVCITWLQAKAYAAWLAKVTGQPWRLPTEAEWEKAARGTDGRIYPWGNQWEKTKANTNDGGGGPMTTTSVGSYAEKDDASPYGAHDLAGNVLEWTSSIYQIHAPYRADQAEKDADTTSRRVLRGGSWGIDFRTARVAYRMSMNPGDIVQIAGVRMVRGVGAGA